ncbi:AAA family ATPase [Polycladidibacter hongkongensis]|uniref:AAA family ATPase n=1 Tax=Polycladidibacter hongkongensis TaxID=1647556 RepID=UPI000835F143|nr:ATP-binding protein [Pseudovibrio hongkongensis]
MTGNRNVVNGGFAPLKNVALAMQLANKLIDRDFSLPGFGVFYGPSGFGKTQSSIFVQNKTGATRIEIADSWTKKKMVSAILMELGVQKPRGTIADLTEQAIHLLSDNPHQPLIIDEADKLIEKKLVELVREIQEHSQAPVLLLGEELLPQKLEQYERAHNRVLDFVGALPCDLDDTMALARCYAPKLQIMEDLAQRICDETHGRARRIATTLVAVREFATNAGLERIDSTDYTGKIISGASPATRRLGK